MIEAVSRGEFALGGLRNRDLRRLLYPRPGDAQQESRRSAAITRKLALLRAQGLLRKVFGTHRYQVTEKGRRILTALIAGRQADVNQLTHMAA